MDDFNYFHTNYKLNQCNIKEKIGSKLLYQYWSVFYELESFKPQNYVANVEQILLIWHIHNQAKQERN